MLVLTPHGHLGYVTAQADGRSHVLLLEEFSMREYPTSDLRALVLTPAR